MRCASAKADALNKWHTWQRVNATDKYGESDLRITYSTCEEEAKDTRCSSSSTSCSRKQLVNRQYRNAEQTAPKAVNEPATTVIVDDETSVQQKERHARLSLGKLGHHANVRQLQMHKGGEPPVRWHQEDPQYHMKDDADKDKGDANQMERKRGYVQIAAVSPGTPQIDQKGRSAVKAAGSPKSLRAKRAKSTSEIRGQELRQAGRGAGGKESSTAALAPITN